VTTTAAPAAERDAGSACPPRPPLERAGSGRWLGGVACGVAAHLGAPVAAVRVVFAGLALAGGAGVVGYVLLWALLRPAAEADTEGAAEDGGPRRARWSPADGAGGQLVAGVALLAVGATALAQRAGLPVSPGAVASACVALAGAFVVWEQLDAGDRDRWLARAGGGAADGGPRLLVGVLLAAAGVVLLALRGEDTSVLRPVVASVAAVLAGTGLLLAPWAVRFAAELRAERAARVREAERAEMAAHLHDSVLQTLALIQRSSADPAAVTTLARAQERELRAWLYGGGPDAAGRSLATAVRAEVAAVEEAHGVPVEVVVVGDRPLGRPEEALVQALREAVLNAVRHGAAPVQVYVEAGASEVEAFVRDHGAGVDLDAVPPDRLGLRESVLGRMARAGGSAAVRPAPGGGTEVSLRLGPVQEPR